MDIFWTSSKLIQLLTKTQKYAQAILRAFEVHSLQVHVLYVPWFVFWARILRVSIMSLHIQFLSWAWYVVILRVHISQTQYRLCSNTEQSRRASTYQPTCSLHYHIRPRQCHLGGLSYHSKVRDRAWIVDRYTRLCPEKLQYIVRWLDVERLDPGGLKVLIRTRQIQRISWQFQCQPRFEIRPFYLIRSGSGLSRWSMKMPAHEIMLWPTWLKKELSG